MDPHALNTTPTIQRCQPTILPERCPFFVPLNLPSQRITCGSSLGVPWEPSVAVVAAPGLVIFQQALRRQGGSQGGARRRSF